MLNLMNNEREELLLGLTAEQKSISSKYFYDKRGSELFDQITQVQDYYPTRIEQKIMRDNIVEICSSLNKDTLLIEPGSGSNKKIRFLLGCTDTIAAYMPIDVSEAYMQEQAEDLQADFMELSIHPVSGDYSAGLTSHSALADFDSRLVFYPGSSLGNFSKSKAREILASFASFVGSEGKLLIGLDLQKPKAILERAYDDSQGITAEFNLNALACLNDKFGTDFDLSNFKHLAFYNEAETRIEMHLVSSCDQRVQVAGQEIFIKEAETICTEYSYKYDIKQFAADLSDLMTLKQTWMDEKQYFSVSLFEFN
jgi:dimethylhistidine N-methyltransferase